MLYDLVVVTAIVDIGTDMSHEKRHMIYQNNF